MLVSNIMIGFSECNCKMATYEIANFRNYARNTSIKICTSGIGRLIEGENMQHTIRYS